VRPRRSPGRGPPYWRSRVLRRQALGEEDDPQGRRVAFLVQQLGMELPR
jgi:hypothetical protein